MTTVSIGTGVQLAVETLRTSHLLVQGASGSGKSYLLRVLAEQLCQHVQTIIIDPEGEYHTLREKFPFVLVGESGETPARINTAELLAKRLVEVGASAVCDIYALDKEEQQQWVMTFLDALMSLPRSTWKALVVIIDESHLFAPEKGEGSAHSTRSVENFCSRARKHGIGIILATQRITKLSNNCVSEMQNYLIGRTFMQGDRERAAKALGIPKRQAEMEQFFSDLKILKPGQFWALGVAISPERIMVTVGKAVTTHPEPGALAHHKPPTPDEIRNLLPKLADLPKEAEEELGELERLRNEVRHLELSLAIKSRDAHIEAVANQQIAELEESLQAIQEEILELRSGQMQGRERLGKSLDMLRAGIPYLQQAEKATAEMLAEVVSQPAPVLPRSPVRLAKVVEAGDPGTFVHKDESYSVPEIIVRGGEVVASEFTGGARKLLAAVLTYHQGLSRGQAKILCGFADRTLTNYVSELRVAGALTTDGGLLRVVRWREQELSRQVPRLAPPKNTSEVLHIWRQWLTGGANKLLDLLLQKRGAAVSREHAMQVCEFAERTLTNYVSELSVAGLLVRVSGGIAANKEALFL